MNHQNIINYIKEFGANKTCIEAMSLTIEPYAIIGKKYSFSKDALFELAAFTYSYLELYLQINLKKEEEPLAKEFFADSIACLNLILEKSVSAKEMKARIPNPTEFIINKLIAYTAEIISMKQEGNYLPKYLFSSFLMYPTFDVSLTKEKCIKIKDEFAIEFLDSINEIIKYLINICEYFSEFLKIERK